MTLVAELILYGGHLSPNLQARFFKLYPASSFWLDCQQLLCPLQSMSNRAKRSEKRLEKDFKRDVGKKKND